MSVEPQRLPRPLREGHAISLVAPASPPKPQAYQAAIEAIERAGYTPKTYRDVCDASGYLAGADEVRIEELHAAFADPTTRLILSVRGGYGAGRIVDRLDFDLLTANPKLVCGYSDISSLHAAVQSHTGLPSIHGPNLIDGVGDTSDIALGEREQWRRLVSGELGIGGELLPAAFAENTKTLVGGVATGKLIGGNLAGLATLLATSEEPSFDGALLFLEDVGEAPYRLDRMLTQLRVSGRLAKVAGIVTGYFSELGADAESEVSRLLDEFLTPLGVPVLSGFPAGHEHPNLPLPFGATAELDASARRLTLRQAIVAETTA